MVFKFMCIAVTILYKDLAILDYTEKSMWPDFETLSSSFDGDSVSK